MRFLIAVLALTLALRPVGAAPTTPDAFIAALKSAIAAQSTDQLLALTYTAGMTDAAKQQSASINATLLFGSPIDSITLGPLPDDFQKVYVANGKKIESSAPPKGYAIVKFAKGSSGGSSSISIAYAIVDGNYCLVGPKITDLGWKGPHDKSLLFNVMGKGTVGGIKVDVKWNASGVEQERTYKTTNMGFMGQYFETVTVTSPDPTADLALELMENGKDITPPIKGHGTITYKK